MARNGAPVLPSSVIRDSIALCVLYSVFRVPCSAFRAPILLRACSRVSRSVFRVRADLGLSRQGHRAHAHVGGRRAARRRGARGAGASSRAVFWSFSFFFTHLWCPVGDAIIHAS